MPHQEGGQSSSGDETPPLGGDGKEKKRPIPLPRRKLNVDCDSESSSSSKRSFRKRIRTASENLNGTSKAVLESTKQVRTKLKSVLSRPGSVHKKRNSVFHDTPDRTEEDRRQSMPVDDIIHKISFVSPLDLGTQIRHWRGDFNDLNTLEDTLPCDSDTFDDSDVTSVADSSVFYYDSESIGLPPPSYPPPPLPRDDVSECSSVSGSSYYTVGTLDTRSFCDEVLDTVNRLSNINLTSKELVRSESWSFHGSPSPWKREETAKERVEAWPERPEYEGTNDPWVRQDSKTTVKVESWNQCDTPQGQTQVAPSVYETVVLSIIPPSSPIYTSSPSQHAKPTTSPSQNLSSTLSLNSPSSHPNSMAFDSPASSELVSSESSCSHPASVSILSSDYPTSNRSSDYDNHRLRSISIVSTSKSVQSNHSYENWELPCTRDSNPNGDPSSQTSSYQAETTPTWESNPQLHCSQSVIFEFDPLLNLDNVPKPPERVDSISEETKQVQDIDTPGDYTALDRDKSLTPELQTDSPPAGRTRQAWKGMKQAIKNLTENPNRRGSKSSELLLAKDTEPGPRDRPVFSSMNTCIYNGSLYKDMQLKYFQLSEGKLFWANDKSAPMKELLNLETLLSVKRISEVKQTTSSEDIHCFSVSTSQSKSKPYLLGATCTSERRIWMQKLLESCTQNFSTKITSDYSRAGWCSLKEGVTNDWSPAWVLLQARVFLYSLDGSTVVHEVDLKKSRSIEYQEDTTLQSHVILVDTPSQVLYLHMSTVAETQAWRHDMKSAATNNGPLLVDQQLTRDEIPTLVDKCLNFVFSYGSMSEGIYRRPGSNTNVSKLLADLRQDAWRVQLSREQYTEHDVSTVLKRFFRDLPEPLLSTELHKHLCNAAGMDCSPEDKVHIYRSLLEKLHPVHYVTVRKLMGHLYFIQEKRDINKMSVENLASIWGPTLMHVESKDLLEWSKREAEAVADLITYYPKLFHVEEDEMAREREMMQVLERYHYSAVVTPQVNKPSGDLKVWIYLGSKESNNCVNVELDPSKEAGQVCKELCSRLSPPSPSHELCLMEVVCEGSLTRALHHKEKVLPVVLEWGYWDEADRKDNALVLCTNEEWRNEIAPMFKQPQAVCGDLKFADRKSKTFKSYLFEFSQSKLCYYKDKKGSIKLGEWKIEDIIWYQGYEKKRPANARWSVTFIPHHKTKRCKETPWFGYTIAGCTMEEKNKWKAAMLFGQYGASNLLPKADFM